MSSIHALLEPRSFISLSTSGENKLEEFPVVSESKPENGMAEEIKPPLKECISSVENDKDDVETENGQKSQSIVPESESQFKFEDINLSAFQRSTKKTLLGFGPRSFPPKLNSGIARFFQLKTNAPPGLC